MITIVTDSSAYLKKKEAIELGVVVVPLRYRVNEQQFYQESYSDQNGDFEALLKGNAKVSTSQPSVGVFLSCFQEELTKGNQVLCITMSSRLSSTFGVAYAATRQMETNDVLVFDSQMTAGGLYLLIREARKLIADGLEIGEVLKALPAIRNRISIAFSVDDITPLRNSGRLGFVRMSVSTILNIKPILKCEDGIVVNDGVAHGSTDIIRKLVGKISPQVSSVVVNYIQNQRLATYIYNILKAQHPNMNVKLRKMGPILAIHLGLHVVAVSFITT